MFKWFLSRALMRPDDDAGGAGGGDDDNNTDDSTDDAKTILDAAGGGDDDKAGGGNDDDQDDGKWYWSDGVEGEGEAPEWLKRDKFKTVMEQAKAMPGLEEKIGPAAELLGAPEGDYELPKMPEGVDGEWNTEDPMLVKFQEVAKKMNLSQGAFDQVATAMAELLAEEEAEAEANVRDAIAKIGTNAEARITQVDTYLKSKLDDDGYTALNNAIAADVTAYLALEAIISDAATDAQTSALPGKRGLGFTKEDIEKEQYKVYPDGHALAGKLMYDHDKEHRAKVDKMWKELYPGEDRTEVG